MNIFGYLFELVIFIIDFWISITVIIIGICIWHFGLLVVWEFVIKYWLFFLIGVVFLAYFSRNKKSDVTLK